VAFEVVDETRFSWPTGKEQQHGFDATHDRSNDSGLGGERLGVMNDSR
jgi:hypothetical protein